MPVDDRLIRGIGIPFFGVGIPSVTGLAAVQHSSALFMIASYLYFILVVGVVWEGNRYLLFRYYPDIFRSRSVIQKFTLMTGINVFYTVPVAAS